MKRKTFVIGGTGTIGQSLIELLQKAGEDFTVLARTPAKAAPLQEAGVQTVIGELGDRETIKNYLNNVNTVFLLTNPAPEQVALQNELVDLAVLSEVKKIVKISVIGAESGSPIHLADWHGKTEEHLKTSGLQYVILQPHSFMQNLLMNIPTIKEQGAIYQSLGEAKIPLVDTRDIAKASFQAITSDDYNNHSFVITGGSPVSYTDVAAALSKATGRQIHYIAIPIEAHRNAMKEAGLPTWLADDLANMNAALQQVAEHPPSGDFEFLTQTQQVTLQQFALDYAEYFK